MNGVRNSADLKRILALPRRSASGDFTELVAELTDILSVKGKCPGKPGPKGICDVCNAPTVLRSVQALALHDIAMKRGGLLPIGVGEGKTLISMLAPFVLDAKKPLLLLPATLIENANRARRLLGNHWLVANHMQICSYEMLGREAAADFLEDGNFDAVLGDEAHRLKNLGGAACARRMARFMAKHSTTPFVPMSGTLIRDSIMDFQHLAFWSLKDGTPLPFDPNQLADWAGALDEPKAGRFGFDEDETDPGALLQLCSEDELREQDPVTAARLGFRRRLTETHGVVATAGDREHVGASIRITALVYELEDASTEQRFSTLRNDMETPDGFELLTGVEVWRHARELALGFHSIWDPWPPKEWLLPRKAWGSFVRAYLSRSRTLDSPDQVKQAVLAGKIDDGGLLAAWEAMEPTYTPNVVEIWHDDSVIKRCAAWGKKPGIIWIPDHVFFGERLSKETGLPYYQAGGYDSAGVYIEDSTSPTIIASLDANKDGKELQFKWSRNLLVGPPDGWDAFQQVVARTHRPHQKADEVIVDILVGCLEHVTAWRKIKAGTIAARDTIGGTPKLELADVNFPTEEEIRRFRGSRWARNGQRRREAA